MYFITFVSGPTISQFAMLIFNSTLKTKIENDYRIVPKVVVLVGCHLKSDQFVMSKEFEYFRSLISEKTLPQAHSVQVLVRF